MTSRYSGFSIYAVSLRINQVFALVCVAIAALALGAAAVLMQAPA